MNLVLPQPSQVSGGSHDPLRPQTAPDAKDPALGASTPVRPQSAPASALAVGSTPDSKVTTLVPPSPKKVSKYANDKPKVISKISTLHDHAHPMAMFVFDIDETLVMSPHRGRLFTPEGMAEFETQLNALSMPDNYKQTIIERMQALLDQKVLVEKEYSASVVRHLQALGCWVFGLTSRYCSTAVRTDAMLGKLDIDFSRSTPLPCDLSLQDPGTGAVYSRGVIYTNAMDKGFVLNRFLENVLLRDLWDANNNLSGTGLKEGEEFALKNDQTRLPSQIVFIDDRLSNSESVLQGLSIAEKFDIPVFSYHYTGATEDEDLALATDALCIDQPYKPTKYGGCVGDSIEDIFPLLFPPSDTTKPEDKEKIFESLRNINKENVASKKLLAYDALKDALMFLDDQFRAKSS